MKYRFSVLIISSLLIITHSTANIIGSADRTIPPDEPTLPPNHVWDGGEIEDPVRDEIIESDRSTAAPHGNSVLSNMLAHLSGEQRENEKRTNNDADIPDRDLDRNSTEKRGREIISGGGLPTRPEEPVTEEIVTESPREEIDLNQTTSAPSGHESENLGLQTTKHDLPDIVTPYTPLFTRGVPTYPPEIEDNTTKPEISTLPTTPTIQLSTTPITTVPTTPITTVPTSPITTIPTSPITTIPTSSITTVPTTPITTLPTTPITTVPTTTITTVPTTPITTLPTTPMSTLSTAPSIQLSTAPITTPPTTPITTQPATLRTIPQTTVATAQSSPTTKPTTQRTTTVAISVSSAATTKPTTEPTTSSTTKLTAPPTTTPTTQFVSTTPLTTIPLTEHRTTETTSPTRPRHFTGASTAHSDTPYARHTTKILTTKKRIVTIPSSSNRTTFKPLITALTLRPLKTTTKTTPMHDRSNPPSTVPSTVPIKTPKSTKGSHTYPASTTVKAPPSNPKFYFTITLQMNWCQFCKVKDTFKSLILSLVGGENWEIEVVIYDNLNQCVQCKPVDFRRHRVRTTPIWVPAGRPRGQNTDFRPPPKYKRGVITHAETMWSEEKEHITLKVSVNDKDSGEANKDLTEMASKKLIIREEVSESFRGKITGVQLFLEEDLNSHEDQQEKKDDQWSTIIYITISCVMAICLISLIIIAVVIVRRRGVRQRSHSSMRPSVRYRGGEDDSFSINSCTIRSFRRSGRKQQSQRSVKTVGGAVNDAFYPDQGQFTNAMTLSRLSTRSLESDYLEEELKMIPMNMPKISTLPQAALAKNRYANVIPLESSRVVLEKKPRGQCTEYINANYVRGYNQTPHAYIATQAPLDSTVADFWRMIWENQSQVIIMMMQWYEDNQRRCAQYLPENEIVDSIAVFGEFEVFMKQKVVTSDYISTHIKLKHMDLNLCRDIVQFQYLEFPMKSCPPVNDLINFIRVVRPYIEASHGPPIVHCTTGTGRTGVFIALDLSMQVFDDSNTVDIMNSVYKLRQDRAGSVHSVTHYAFLYKAMLEYANRGSRAPSHMGSIQSLNTAR